MNIFNFLKGVVSFFYTAASVESCVSLKTSPLYISPFVAYMYILYFWSLRLPRTSIEIRKDHGQSPIHSAQTLKACISESV